MTGMADDCQPITPIFLFSLQRSGSTLTQRMIATHPDVETSGEPWILLPLFYMRIKRGVYAEYEHHVVVKGVDEFCRGLPGGESDLYREIREMILRLYRARAGNRARYFIDKTPRYHVISSDIIRAFPDAKFVFLWRNPLAIVSSFIETWGAGRWNIYEFAFDLYDGLAALIAARQMAGSRACSIAYEDVVNESSGAMARVFDYLGLEFDADRTRRFTNVETTGVMWDPTGVKRYQAVSQEPRERWKATLASPVRKWWCRRYLRWIGKERLAVMGYDDEQILSELDAIPNRYATVPSDILRLLFGLVVRAFEPWIVRDKLGRLLRGERLYAMR
jgi:hypothetical protein